MLRFSLFLVSFLWVSLAIAEEPYLILVDKVFSRNPTQQISEADYARIESMGFNVLSPRWSKPDNGLIPRDLELCRKHNLKFLPWMRGTFPNDGESTQDKSLTSVSGVSSPLFSPNSDEFWEKMEERLLQAAAIPAPNIGIFLDFEHYAKPKIMEPYNVSFDEETVAKFTADTGKKAQDDRDAFKDWTVTLWQQRSAALATKVKQAAPDFQLFIYPGISTPFLSEFSRAMRAVGIPVYSAGASTYDRPTFMTLEGARERVTTIVQRGTNNADLYAPGAKYLAGLDPAVKGSTPSLYDLTMRLAAEHGAGYWIFFEGVHRNIPLLDEYCAAFTRANKAIKNKDFSLKDIPPEKGAPEPPKFERPGTKKVFVTGERRRSISKFLNSVLPEQYEAFHMEGAVLAEIEHFDILILQSLKLMEADRDHTVAALRAFVNNGGVVLLSYISVLEPLALFPEIAVQPAAVVEHLDFRQVGKTRVIMPPLTEANERLEVFYPYYYIITLGPQAQILATDHKQQCVAAGGAFGKGKVAFAGDFFGRQDDFTSENERKFFTALLRWLTDNGN